MNFDNKKYIGIINNAFKIYSCVDTLNTKNDLLKCGKTGRIIDDVHNKSGGVLKHLKTIYPDLVVESNYKRKQIEKETGKYWYHDYFEFN